MDRPRHPSRTEGVRYSVTESFSAGQSLFEGRDFQQHIDLVEIAFLQEITLLAPDMPRGLARERLVELVERYRRNTA